MLPALSSITDAAEHAEKQQKRGLCSKFKPGCEKDYTPDYTPSTPWCVLTRNKHCAIPEAIPKAPFCLQGPFRKKGR